MNRTNHSDEHESKIRCKLPLLPYTPGMVVEDLVQRPLEAWPFDNPKSDYKILLDDDYYPEPPQASGRIDSSTATSRVGIWKCTRGKFQCTEQGDELMTILSGKVRVTDVHSGQVVELGPGQSMFSYHGKRVTWEVLEDVTKVFYGNKSDGY